MYSNVEIFQHIHVQACINDVDFEAKHVFLSLTILLIPRNKMNKYNILLS